MHWVRPIRHTHRSSCTFRRRELFGVQSSTYRFDSTSGSGRPLKFDDSTLEFTLPFSCLSLHFWYAVVFTVVVVLVVAVVVVEVVAVVVVAVVVVVVIEEITELYYLWSAVPDRVLQ